MKIAIFAITAFTLLTGCIDPYAPPGYYNYGGYEGYENEGYENHNGYDND